jgi:hypothetical protein
VRRSGYGCDKPSVSRAPDVEAQPGRDSAGASVCARTPRTRAPTCEPMRSARRSGSAAMTPPVRSLSPGPLERSAVLRPLTGRRSGRRRRGLALESRGGPGHRLGRPPAGRGLGSGIERRREVRSRCLCPPESLDGSFRQRNARGLRGGRRSVAASRPRPQEVLKAHARRAPRAAPRTRPATRTGRPRRPPRSALRSLCEQAAPQPGSSTRRRPLRSGPRSEAGVHPNAWDASLCVARAPDVLSSPVQRRKGRGCRPRPRARRSPRVRGACTRRRRRPSWHGPGPPMRRREPARRPAVKAWRVPASSSRAFARLP